MTGKRIRVLELRGTPTQAGTVHGERFAADIRDYTTDRVALSAAGTDWRRGDLLALAAEMLPAHEAYDAALFEEMTSMAAAAGIEPAEAVIVGGYTDFIDAVRARAGGAAAEDTCTAVLVPNGLAGGAGFLAQTWDMHASATQHIVMLDAQVDGGPRSLVFTTVGTVGQIGMNEAGIAVGINNLTAGGGRAGVTWPFVVRKALRQTDLEGALQAVLEAPLAGGHSFLLLDSRGRGYTVEAMPDSSVVTPLGSDLLAHTNHCLFPSTRALEDPRPPDLQESSIRRLASVPALLAERPVTVDHLIAMTRDQEWICRHPSPPYHYESCGAAIMRPATGDFWACWGIPSENEYEHLRLETER